MELTPLQSSSCECDGMFVQCEPAVAADKTLAEFFHAVKALQRATGDLSATEHAWHARERELAGALESTKVEVHAALCDNVDTPRTLRSLLVRAPAQRIAYYAYWLLTFLRCRVRRWCAPPTRT